MCYIVLDAVQLYHGSFQGLGSHIRSCTCDAQVQNTIIRTMGWEEFCSRNQYFPVG